MLFRSIIRNEEPLPDKLKGTSLITAMEEHIKKYPNPDLAYELANSHLITETSLAAQELRLAAERTPDSATAKIIELKKVREEKALKGRKTVANVKKTLKIETEKNNLSKEDLSWNNFLKKIEC